MRLLHCVIYCISLGIFIPRIVFVAGCLTNCSDCLSSSACNASIAIGNQCKWNLGVCEDITNANSGNTYKIIPIPGTTSFAGQVEDEYCICKAQYFSISLNTQQQSCNCSNGIKILMIKYIGDTILNSVVFYHDYDNYENCSFTNVEPNHIMQCSSFPYSRFASNIKVNVNGINDVNICQSSIDTSCITTNSNNILNTFVANCTSLKIVGWIDDSNYICNSDVRRRRLSSGDSSDSSSGSSDSSTSSFLFDFDSSSSSKSNQKPKIIYKTPSPATPVVPLDTTLEPTVYNAQTSQTLETSETPPTPSPSYDVYIETVSPTESYTQSPFTADELKNIYCECDSAESWDDFHYYNANGDLVIISNDLYPETNQGNLDSDNNNNGARIRMKDKTLSASNMVPLNNDGVTQCNYINIIVVVLVVSCFMFI